MALNYVTLILDMYDGSGAQIRGGSALLAPSEQLTDPVDGLFITQAGLGAAFGPGALPRVSLLATDNTNVAPSGWEWTITFNGVPGNPPGGSFALPFTNGATQYLSAAL
jgi:hypothetical protein